MTALAHETHRSNMGYSQIMKQQLEETAMKIVEQKSTGNEKPLIVSVTPIKQAKGRDQSSGTAVRRSDTHNW